MIQGILPLIVLIGLIVLVVRALSRRTETPTAAPGLAVRRFVVYAALLVVLAIVGVGLAGVIEHLLPRARDVAERDTAALARALAFVIVGTPVYVGLGIFTHRRLRSDPDERSSFGWAFYLNAALTALLITAGGHAFAALASLFAVTDYQPAIVAGVVVWPALWAAHWWLAARHAEPERWQVARLAGAAVGLIALAVALGAALVALLGAWYEQAFDATVVEQPWELLRWAATGMIVAAPVWWWHWVRHAARERRTDVWHGYLLLFGVLAAAVTTLIAAATALYLALQWIIGEPDAARAAVHFDALPGLVAALAVGVAIWRYHHVKLAEESGQERSEIDRVYDHLLAGVGLVAATVGLAVLLVALVQAGTPQGDATETPGGDLVALAATMLVTGAPLWLVGWGRVQHLARVWLTERAAPTRRVYLVALFGVGGAAALVGVINAVLIGLQHLLDGTLGAATLHEARVAVSVVLATGAMAGYHAWVYRRDRALLPAPARAAVRDVVVVCGDGDGLSAALARELGAKVRVWHRLDTEAAVPVPTDAVVAALRQETHEHVLVVADPEGAFRLVPFDTH